MAKKATQSVTLEELGNHLVSTLADSGITITKASARDAVKGLFKLIHTSADQGANVQIRNFGTWSYRNTKPGKGRNPQTGQSVPVPGGRKFVFKASDATRQREGE